MKALQIYLNRLTDDRSIHRLTATASELAEYDSIRLKSHTRVNRAALLVTRAVSYHANWLRYMENVLPNDSCDRSANGKLSRDKYLWADFPCHCDECGVHRECYRRCWPDNLVLAEIACRTYACSHIELCMTCARNRRRKDVVRAGNGWSTCVECN